MWGEENKMADKRRIEMLRNLDELVKERQMSGELSAAGNSALSEDQIQEIMDYQQSVRAKRADKSQYELVKQGDVAPVAEYKPTCDVRFVPENTTPRGLSSRVLVTIQEEEQKRIAENSTWLLARRVNMAGDSRKSLEKLGFSVATSPSSMDTLFYEAQPPKGWTKSTSGYWTTIRDKKGNERISQFYKGAIYDQDAFLNIPRLNRVKVPNYIGGVKK